MDRENILKPVIETIRTALQQQAGRKALFQAALSKETVQAYLAAYYAEDFYGDVGLFMQKFDVPRVLKLANGTSMLTGADNSFEPFDYDTALAEGGARPVGTYPLSLAEVEIAGQAFDANPLFKKTMAGFQAGIVAYLTHLVLVTEDFLSKGRTMDDRDDEFVSISMTDTAISDMQLAADGSSFINELLPVILSQWENADQLSGAEFRKGLVFAFQRSAFKSFEGGWSGKPKVTHCPFSKMVGHLADTVLEKDKNGTLVVAERTEPGALLMFIAKRIEELEVSPRPSGNTYVSYNSPGPL